MIGLISDGQEIHLGEESGLVQWNTAISQMNRPWVIYCPNQISSLFTSANSVSIDDYLNLNTSLRSHIAEYVQTWVKQLLDGKLSTANLTASKIYSQSFDMYFTRDLATARSYVNLRYAGQIDSHYGFLASSKARNLESFGIHNSFQWTKNLREGPWYNDPPSSKTSCCQLNEVATEFSCQGLELDFPIISWGDDLIWSGNHWSSPPPRPRNQARDPHQLRINSYRVLLTRGRDGFIVFVPPTSTMNSTYQALKILVSGS